MRRGVSPSWGGSVAVGRRWGAALAAALVASAVAAAGCRSGDARDGDPGAGLPLAGEPAAEAGAPAARAPAHGAAAVRLAVRLAPLTPVEGEPVTATIAIENVSSDVILGRAASFDPNVEGEGWSQAYLDPILADGVVEDRESGRVIFTQRWRRDRLSSPAEARAPAPSVLVSGGATGWLDCGRTLLGPGGRVAPTFTLSAVPRAGEMLTVKASFEFAALPAGAVGGALRVARGGAPPRPGPAIGPAEPREVDLDLVFERPTGEELIAPPGPFAVRAAAVPSESATVTSTVSVRVAPARPPLVAAREAARAAGLDAPVIVRWPAAEAWVVGDGRRSIAVQAGESGGVRTVELARDYAPWLRREAIRGADTVTITAFIGPGGPPPRELTERLRPYVRGQSKGGGPLYEVPAAEVISVLELSGRVSAPIGPDGTLGAP